MGANSNCMIILPSFWLWFALCYLSFVIHYLLLAIGFVVFVICLLLFDICLLLFAICYLLCALLSLCALTHHSVYLQIIRVPTSFCLSRQIHLLSHILSACRVHSFTQTICCCAHHIIISLCVTSTLADIVFQTAWCCSELSIASRVRLHVPHSTVASGWWLWPLRLLAFHVSIGSRCLSGLSPPSDMYVCVLSYLFVECLPIIAISSFSVLSSSLAQLPTSSLYSAFGQWFPISEFDLAPSVCVFHALLSLLLLYCVDTNVTINLIVHRIALSW